jgi:hypothetical protein
MTLEELSCKAECQDLALKLFSAIDAHDKTIWDSVVTEDAQQVVPGGAPSPLSDTWEVFPANFVPVHIVTNVIITPTGSDTADGILHTTAYHIYAGPGDGGTRPMPSTPSGVGKMGLGFTRTSAGWRISELRLMLPIFDDGGPTNVDRPNRPPRQ